MRYGIDVKTPLNGNPDYDKTHCTVTPNGNGVALVPDDWTNIPFTVDGDGITPVPGKSYLSSQPDGTLQARVNAGPWETFYINGAIITGNAQSAPADKTVAFHGAQIG